MKDFVSRNVLALLLTVTALVVAVHYIFFVSAINEDRKCRGEYNTLSVKSIEETQRLSLEGYQSQNDTIDKLVEAFVEGQAGGDPSSSLQAALMKSQNARADLDRRYAANKLPELPKCFN
jgi:hypothetical protein